MPALAGGSALGERGLINAAILGLLMGGWAASIPARPILALLEQHQDWLRGVASGWAERAASEGLLSLGGSCVGFRDSLLLDICKDSGRKSAVVNMPSEAADRRGRGL